MRLNINTSKLINPRVIGRKNVPKKRRARESKPSTIAEHISEYVTSE